MSPRVDLYLWGGGWESIYWPLGEVIIAENGSAFASPSFLKAALRSPAPHLLFWHRGGGAPPWELVAILASGPLDVWHGGLKLGLGGQPSALDILEPTWIYHKDGDPGRIQSSFRISLRACLIRRELLDIYMPTQANYTQVEALGLDMGYYLWKSGALIRYHPGLVRHAALGPVIIDGDQQWEFVRRFYGRKWRFWYAIRKGNLFGNLRALFRGPTQPLSARPRIHRSDPQMKTKNAQTISVLAPTLNRYAYLETELKQMDDQDLSPKEILVTDQTPRDQRRKPDYKGKVPLRYFPQDENGQCLAWNKLLSESKGQWVLFLGDDADEIEADFLDRLLGVQQHYEADMVAAFVEEAGIDYRRVEPYRSMSDSFPICLVRKSLLDETGYMDMFFNRTIRADHDLAMRCHLAGALMIHDAGIRVFHHRAPVGGLRTHKARVVTRNMSRKSWRIFVGPTASEIYLAAKYFPWAQVRHYLLIKYLGQISMEGSWGKRLLRIGAFIFQIPRFAKEYRRRSREAIGALSKSRKEDNDESPTSY